MNRFIFFIICFAIGSCSSNKNTVRYKLLIGHWKALADTAYTPDLNVTTENYSNYNQTKKYYITYEGDTIDYWYKLKGNNIILGYGKFLASKNKILLLTKDSLIYKRDGDGKVFVYLKNK
jgi:hypothetical protein